VSLANKQAAVQFDSDITSIALLCDAVEDCGFNVLPSSIPEIQRPSQKSTTVEGFCSNEEGRPRPAQPLPVGRPLVQPSLLPLTCPTTSSSSFSSPIASAATSIARTVTLAVRGLACQRCAEWVRGAVTRLDGVTGVEVDLARHTAVVRGTFAVATLVRCVQDTGYSARLVRTAADDDHSELRAAGLVNPKP